MADRWWSDDEQLLAVLDDALGAARAVPQGFVEAGKAAYSWRTIDAELAALTYDSAADTELVTITRAESATLRALTFAAAGLTIELEVTPEALLGQVSPVQAGHAVAYVGAADAAADEPGASEIGTAVIDELGFFVLQPLPAEPFRLLCKVSSGTSVLTGWISP
jgi:hypothetical protein